MEKFHEATMLSSALFQALTFKALQLIALKLDRNQQYEVVKWAQAQIIAMDRHHGYTRSQKICGNKYLTLDIVDLNLSSILDIEYSCEDN
jgi:hypothetical protein